MNAPQDPAAPESGTANLPDPLADIETRDPEVAEILRFEPVPRANTRDDGWTPPLQRLFIYHLSRTGSPGKACDALQKRRSGIDKLAKKAAAASFRAAWARAVEIAQERRAAKIAADHAEIGDAPLPFIDHRRKSPAPDAGLLPGQVVNEHGDYEDEASYRARGEEAKDSIVGKLLRIRRVYLQEISACPGKRAAFEILTELPVDWELAGKGEPQEFEPWLRTNQRQPDMILTAESGWSFGELGYGPDKKAAARKAIDRHREEMGLEPIDWSDSTERRDADA